MGRSTQEEEEEVGWWWWYAFSVLFMSEQKPHMHNVNPDVSHSMHGKENDLFTSHVAQVQSRTAVPSHPLDILHQTRLIKPK